MVCYTPEVKQALFAIPRKKIEQYTCESREITEELVKRLPRIIEADVYAAVTGLASPGGSESKTKAVGTVFFSVSVKKKIFSERHLFRGTPLEIRKKACDALYGMIYRIAKKELASTKKRDHVT